MRQASGGFGLIGWLRICTRGGAAGGIIIAGLALKLLLRAAEAPLFGPARPVTPYITQAVCRAALRVMGIRSTMHGAPMSARGLVVANHASWLDIFALNAAQRVYFVAKSEVAAWAGIGWLARATGTLFITRIPAHAKRQQLEFEARLRAGQRLLFFPEGTSTDGSMVLPFKPTLFAALYAPNMGQMHVQPASLIYRAPQGRPENFYGWYGDMDFAPHLLQVLAAPRGGHVTLILHPAVAVADYPSRKDLAAACERIVRAGCFSTGAA